MAIGIASSSGDAGKMTAPSTYCKQKDDAPVNFEQRRLPAGSIGRTIERMGLLRKRSVQLSGHATSIALEPEFWAVLETMATKDRLSLAALIGRIDDARAGRPLASACRVAALKFAQDQLGSPPSRG